MKDLLIYSTVAGEIPLLVQKNIPKCFVEYDQYLELKAKSSKVKWNNFETISPTQNVDALICVKWHADPEFSIQIDRWQKDCNDERGGYWLGIEDHCEFVETVADGPGYCNRPVVSHWMVLPDKPE